MCWILGFLTCLGLMGCADASKKTGVPSGDTNNNAPANNDAPQPVDADGDGYSDSVDCDDASAAISPGAEELCDGVDNDCDERIDEGLPLLYPDTDGDSFGDINAPGDCRLAGGVEDHTDCDDTIGTIHPGADEVCNDGIDDDCDGLADDLDDDTTALNTFFRDNDEDTFGDPLDTTDACLPPEGFVDNDLDCDDLAFEINPNADEVCDQLDNNCDLAIDEGQALFYPDNDSDTFGDINATGSCDPTGRVDNNLDCDDAVDTVHPNADEVCNDSVDDDCDGLADDLDDDTTALNTFFRDNDEDTFGDPDNTASACLPPEGFVDNDRDCDDLTFEINPEAAEVCDLIDNNCDELLDEQDPDTELTTFFVDSDGDDYGVDNLSIEACFPPMGYALQGGDCDDANPLRSPGLDEILGDGIDNDCDGFQRAPPEACEGVSVPGDYASLSAAVGALNNRTTPTTICLGPGNFNATFTLGANVHIIGAGAERTHVTGTITVSPSGAHRTIPESRIQHLRLTGNVTLNDTLIYRLTMTDLIVTGRIFVDRDSGGTPHLTIERCDLNNPRSASEAIYVYDYSRTPSERMEIILRNNWIHDSYHGFKMASGGTNINRNHRVVNRVQLDNNTFQGNTYGIQFAGNLTNSIWSYHNNLFLQNSTAARIYYEGTITHDHNAFSGNNTNFRDFAAPDANSPSGDLMIDTDTSPPRPHLESPLKGAGLGPRRSGTDFWSAPRSDPPSIGAVE